MDVDDFGARHLSDEENQKIAARWRAKLNGLFLTNCLDIKALFEAVSSMLERPVKVELRPDRSMGRATAFVSAEKKTVFFRESCVARAAKGDPHAIFDAVHELCHLILHRAPVRLARMADGNREVEFLPPEERAEHQANVFARGFLMTDEEVARYRTAEALSENCFTPLKEAEARIIEYRRSKKPALESDFRTAATEARLKGYDGRACRDCSNFTLVRTGACLTCDTCGGTSGCS
jgi:hypothetical protein